jgi:hypothetical protein
LLNRPRIHHTPIHPKPPQEKFEGWTTKREYPKPKVAEHMIKFCDGFSKLKLEERTADWAEDALDHGHVAFAFLNLPFEPEEEGEGPGLPPGMPPSFMAGGFGIQIGPVTTVGQVLADMGLPPGGGPPP